ncbi:hypothetical protein [Alishewanella sp. HL-SH06]
MAIFMGDITIKLELIMKDGIHPTAETPPLIRDIMLPLIMQLEQAP